ncbi:PH domain-containing protein [Arthrobacter sp. TMN-49]
MRSSWLQEGEQVLLDARPHSRVLLWPITVGLMLILAASAALAKLQAGPFAEWAPQAGPLREPAIVVVVVLVLLVLLAYPVRRALRWFSTHLVLTNQRLVVRNGPLRRNAQFHVLDQIQEVRAVQNWRQKLVGSGDLHLHMYRGAMRTVKDVPAWKDFASETQQAWTAAMRAAIQQTPQQGD